MKNLSLILNAILIVAVAFLFYQVHELKTSGVTPAAEVENSADSVGAKPGKVNSAVSGPSSLADAKIAYVNFDSINERYQFIIDNSKEMQATSKRLQEQLQKLTEAFQRDLEAYQGSAQAGILSEADMKRTEEGLMRQKSGIANKQMELEHLAERQAEKNEELMENLKRHLANNNKGRFDYVLSYSEQIPTILLTNAKLDLTNEVVKSLNEEYKQSKGKK